MNRTARFLLPWLVMIVFALPGCGHITPSPKNIQAHAPANPVDAARMAGIRSRLSALAYAINGTSNDLWARDGRRGWRYRFTAEGLEIGPETGTGNAPRLGLRTAAMGRDKHTQPLPSAAWRKRGGFRVERETPDLIEWYENSAKGLEQGYVLSRKPEGRGGLWIEVALRDGTAQGQGDALQLRDGAGHALDYGQLHAHDAAGRSVPARFQVRDERHVRLVLDDAEAVYPVQIDPLITGREIIQTVAGGGRGDGGPAASASVYADSGLALDGRGHLYVVDGACDCIRQVDAKGTITTVAGNGGFGYSAGDDIVVATQASLNFAHDVAVDGGGNLYIADTDNDIIRVVDASGIMRVIAGDAERDPGYSGDGGPAANALLNRPTNLTLDGAGNLYFTDHGNRRIRKISPAGIITSVAGDGGNVFSGDGGPALQAGLYNPKDLAVDGGGNLYFIDDHRVRKVDAAGLITTIAGSDDINFTGDGGAANLAALYSPEGLALDGQGNLYIADTGHGRVRKIDAAGRIATVAGNGENTAPESGRAALEVGLRPTGVAVDGAGNLYVTASGLVHEVDAAGLISRVAGGGVGDGLPGPSAELAPEGVAFGPDGALYIADPGHDRIRRLDRNGVIATVAGNGLRGFSGDGGPAPLAQLNQPHDVAVGRDGGLYIADHENNRLRRVDASGTITTLASGEEQGLAGVGAVVLAANGEVLVADSDRVHKIDANGSITLFAGGGDEWWAPADGLPATALGFGAITDIAVGDDGQVYFTDSRNCRVWRVDGQGKAFRVAGRGDRVTCDYSGDGGPAREAALKFPYGLAPDGEGNLYVTDSSNHRVRRIDADGIIHTVAGIGGEGFSGDGGDAVSARLARPHGIAVDGSGLYVADSDNRRVRRISAAPRQAASHRLTVKLSGKGTVTSQPKGIVCGSVCGKDFAAGSSVRLAAKAAAGYRFTGWGGACSGAGTCEVAMKTAASVTASFARLYALTVTRQGKGTVTSDVPGILCGKTCSAQLLENTPVTLGAVPAAGYVFKGWSGACSGAGACVVILTGKAKVKAVFVKKP